MSFFPILDISEFSKSLPTDLKEDLFSKIPQRRESSLKRLRDLLAEPYDLPYIENAILPALVTSAFQGEKLSLPMIDEQRFSKENALPYYLWGLLYDNWQPNLAQDGLSVFIQGYENRGDNNHRKRIYYSALTQDLYRPMYGDKVVRFFDQLFADQNANKPLMRRYLDSYFDLYWDLHLGVSGNAIPADVRQIGLSFNTVIAYLNPTEPIVYKNYMQVRKLRQPLKRWIDERINDLIQGRISHPEKTFVYYWLKNGEEGPDFRRKDVVFETFHNFVALSQWGNTIYNMMIKLSVDRGDPTVRNWFKKTMEGNYDQATQESFTPLDRFVMELFRTISPNDFSLSILRETGTIQPIYQRYGYIASPHKATSEQPRHWNNPTEFNPDRYLTAPTSDEIDEARSKEIGFAQCPFHKTSFAVKDGRKAELANSTFGTVYGVRDSKANPVCDYAGYAPFGFGYRRCPGELLTIELFKDFLRKVWRDKIEFKQLNIPNPEKLPIGPVTVIGDNIGFTKAK
jgi:cytochrome P450